MRIISEHKNILTTDERIPSHNIDLLLSEKNSGELYYTVVLKAYDSATDWYYSADISYFNNITDDILKEARYSLDCRTAILKIVNTL